MNAIEVAMKPAFKVARKKSHLAGKEVAKLVCIVPANNDKQKKEPEVKIKNELDESVILEQNNLPQQPQGYIRYPDYDFF